ncbi:conserved hypothetical protein [Ignisphaera aggregans DSM 17230]|uniref:Uncharacterized protein n=1 Tax=Ignisphaera aggregans (strain DSM 17230 / JCM 13409 / AQ1.S1) TaxID=583356 RepID=E0SSK9_IGNAA|nr:conserved hypothetical protein [Ignisphaera aggregans DSM 17230]
MSSEVSSQIVTSKSSVWEEATIEEIVYAIAHLAHAEQHLLEIDTAQGKPILTPLINSLRMNRKIIGETLFTLIGINEKSSGAQFRQKAESLWCTLKHLSMAMIHCDEVAEKIIKRLLDEIKMNNASDSAKTLALHITNIYNVRNEIRNTIIKLLTEVPKNIDLVDTVRCREDLCIETEPNLNK